MPRARRTAAALVATSLLSGVGLAGASSAGAAPAAAPATTATAVGAATAGPAVRPYVPPRRFVSAWLPHWRTAQALASVRANAGLYTDASPFWFQLTRAGAVVPLSRSVRPVRAAATVRALHALGLPVYPTVVERLTAAQMAAFLGDPARRDKHVRDLVALTAAYGVDGVDLDYEAMTFGGGAATRALVRVRFAAFADQLSRALHARGKKLVITVPARTSDADPDWAVYDYARLGAAADRLRIMTYDYGWRGSSPRAVAPVWWVDRVLRYAVTRVPAHKIWMGVPTYGWAWPAGGGRARAVTHAQALAWQHEGGAVRRWQATVGPGDPRPVAAPHFAVVRAGRSWTVYYNDAASAAALTALAGRYRLGGAAFWAVGSEDPATWPAVRRAAGQRAGRPAR